MGELNQSHVNYATDLQKCLNTRLLIVVSVHLFSCLFFNSYIEKKNHKKSGDIKAIIKITTLCYDFCLCAHSPRLYSNGTGNSSKILVAMFSSFCLKPMDIVKVLQNTSNPARLHWEVCQGFRACSICLCESSRKYNNTFTCPALNFFLFSRLALVVEFSGNPLAQRCPVNPQPISLTSTGTFDMKSIK